MSKERLATSRAAGGHHHRLGQLVGTWAGTAKTWFEPGVLADESPIEGTIRPALDGRFVVHEYRGSLQGKPLSGMAIHGYHLDLERFETAWIDSFHVGTAVMSSVGDGRTADGMSVLGHYPDPTGGPSWGWRTRIEMPDPDHLIIIHDNITPDGDESRAVEIRYVRQSS